MKLTTDPKVVSIKSDRFFNDPDGNKVWEDMGYDPIPVDAFGAIVPTDKKLSSLKKTEQNIRQRFQLDPFEVEQGGGES